MALEVCVVIALKSEYGSLAHYGCEERIFAIGLLASSPTRVSEDVYVRCPEGQSIVLLVQSFPDCLIVFCTSLIGNHGECPQVLFRIEGCRHTDGLRKYGCYTGTRNSVQGFVPPVVVRNAETFDSCGTVHHHSYLLFKSQAVQQVFYPLIYRKARVIEREFRFLCIDAGEE